MRMWSEGINYYWNANCDLCTQIFTHYSQYLPGPANKLLTGFRKGKHKCFYLAVFQLNKTSFLTHPSAHFCLFLDFY